MTTDKLQAGDWVYSPIPPRPRDGVGALVKLSRVVGDCVFASLRGRTLEIEARKLEACTITRANQRMIYRKATG